MKTEKVHYIYNSIQFKLVNLFDRWKDEKEFENFDDYSDCIKKELLEIDRNAIFQKATKRPFGMVFVVDGLKAEITLNSKRIQCRVTECVS